MALIYTGKGEGIVGIPAQDLSDDDLKELLSKGTAQATLGRSELSLAELEGLLIKRGLYKSVSKTVAKSSAKEKESE